MYTHMYKASSGQAPDAIVSNFIRFVLTVNAAPVHASLLTPPNASDTPPSF